MSWLIEKLYETHRLEVVQHLSSYQRTNPRSFARMNSLPDFRHTPTQEPHGAIWNINVTSWESISLMQEMKPNPLTFLSRNVQCRHTMSPNLHRWQTKLTQEGPYSESISLSPDFMIWCFFELWLSDRLTACIQHFEIRKNRIADSLGRFPNGWLFRAR